MYTKNPIRRSINDYNDIGNITIIKIQIIFMSSLKNDLRMGSKNAGVKEKSLRASYG